MTNLSAPVILIGMLRSGTTWLGEALSQSTSIAYWTEPRQVWSYGNYFCPDDILTAAHASNAVKQYIHKRFKTYTLQNNATRFCEKTPCNCLRIPFIREIFPDAKFIFLVRDGRAVFRSTREMQNRIFTWKQIRRRFRDNAVRELPAYFRNLPGVWARLRGRPLMSWGVRPPGWREWERTLSRNQFTARQWADTLEIALRDLQAVPNHQKLVMKYEDLTRNPEGFLPALLGFLDVPDVRPIADFIRQTARPERADAWTQELSPECLAEIRPILEPMLTKLDYTW